MHLPPQHSYAKTTLFSHIILWSAISIHLNPEMEELASVGGLAEYVLLPPSLVCKAKVLVARDWLEDLGQICACAVSSPSRFEGELDANPDDYC